MPKDKRSDAAQIENAPSQEAEQIEAVVELTEKQLQHRYAKALPFLRGVHAKDHGCVDATFTVVKDLPPQYHVGVFKNPGRQYRAEIRFSNADPLVMEDSFLVPDPKSGTKQIQHGSRGMAVKLHGVHGERLAEDGADTQDFLMINQPVFAFANVEDYKALSEAIVAAQQKNDPKETPMAFFARLQNPDPKIQERAKRTMGIIARIRSNLTAVPSPPPSQPVPLAFQPPPLSPLDNRYFTAAPFMFGKGRVAKFSAKPVAPVSGVLGDEVSDRNYLRTALNKRLTAAKDDIEFEFQVQVRDIESIEDVDKDIEDACTLWDEEKFPFVTVARISIPPQDVNARKEACERLVFTPWHGLADHKPIGGINRLRRAVYERSAQLRGCPAGAAAGETGKGPPEGVGPRS